MDDFKIKLVQHLLSKLTVQAESFQSLLSQSLNCDPAVLLCVLNEMEDLGLISSRFETITQEYSLTRLGIESTSVKEQLPEVTISTNTHSRSSHILNSSYFQGLTQQTLNSLPTPTPVYSQWWFSDETYARIVSYLMHIVEAKKNIAFVGSSSLGAVFSHCTDAHVTIADVDQILLRRLSPHVGDRAELVEQDIFHTLNKSLQRNFDVVVVDPPWSSSCLKTFLVRSSMMLADRGVLFISFPPIFTRPSAQKERKYLLRIARSLGLSTATVLPSFTEYIVPEFERHAYERHGISLNQPWRKGDVFVFKKQSDSVGLLDLAVQENAVWDQYDYGLRRLFLKKNGSTIDEPLSIFPVTGQNDFHYDSTSSRSSSWKQASLVSTDNRIASTSGRRELAYLLTHLQMKRNSLGEYIKSLRGLTQETETAILAFLSDYIREESIGDKTACQKHRERNSYRSLRT